ncbi:hypothetical protein GKZ90_0013135 [Flavobacterium sp. MC2016-06]|jgi:hypothetical protein|uniref:hypothetical protein n=1 Tax=Flavobacterium sp. MC2016-06 TaxID=2676308 RepID=UPI0012BA676E|nr:hypothetical protein [Flavobacterium sp. MC2016-06]MBU3859967.1 hypothetical protein [Flavobacterium sp. MC2016-06]
MNSEKYKWTKRFLILTPFFLLFSMFIAGGGHGFVQPIFALFPFATFTCIWMSELGFLNLILALIQFPVYGLLIDKANDKKRTWIIISILHFLIATLIILYANPNWINK